MIRFIGRNWKGEATSTAKPGSYRSIQEAPFEPDSFTSQEAQAAVKRAKYANPKQAYGDKKVPLQLIPPVALAYMGMALKEGARKYGAYNWRDNDVELMTYAGAAMRHIACWIDREDIDPESGNPHIAHALASLAILVDAVECRVAIDNRPPEGGAPRVLADAAT